MIDESAPTLIKVYLYVQLLDSRSDWVRIGSFRYNF